MSENLDIRGGLGENAPLKMVGEFTGYNNGATMQVGLWIRNDGSRIDAARSVAMNSGPGALADHLTAVMARAADTDLPGMVRRAAMESEGGLASIDWAQIAYDLIDDEPDEDDLATAREQMIVEYGEVPGESEVFRAAVRHREAWARERALGSTH